MSGLSKASVTRLPSYLRLLDHLNGASDTVVSSGALALAADTNPANARRDLSVLGFQGTRGVGYSVPALRDRIRRELGIESRRKVAIVGAGNLGTALARYSGLSKRGFDVVAIYDVNPKLLGKPVGDISVQGIEEMSKHGRVDFEVAILAVPAGSAQGVADELVAAGIASILNFAPVRVEVPETVAVRQVDLSTELQILSYYG